MIVPELVVDTNVISFVYRGGALGDGYLSLIGGRPGGVTVLTLVELH